MLFPAEFTKNELRLSKGEAGSILYHNIFDFPLTQSELIKWTLNPEVSVKASHIEVEKKGASYFLKGRCGLLYKKLLREKGSRRKMETARMAARLLAVIPTVKFVGVTGALAMMNAGAEGDIDVMVITQKGTLWTTRLMVYFLLFISGTQVRRPNEKNEKDKLCLNMWFDESDLSWRRPRNLFTAHEIAQIVPLINKNKTYEQLISKNRWVLNFWPNAVRLAKVPAKAADKALGIFALVEKLAFGLQFAHMRRRMTRETVTSTRAIFHPLDWGKYVLNRLVLDKPQPALLQ